MWAPHQTPDPIEKMRKPQWTKENTAKTQAVVDELDRQRQTLRAVTGNSKVVEAMTAAMKRFMELDQGVNPNVLR